MKKAAAYEFRDIVLIAVFGALWGGVEMSLGGALHLLKIPMRGTFLAAFGIGIMLVGYGITRKPWFVFSTSLICCTIKLFSFSGFMLSPLLSILAEGILAEVLLRVLPVSRIGYIGAAFGVILYSTVHYFLAQGVLFGHSVYMLYLRLLESVSSFFNIPMTLGIVVLIVIIAIKLMLSLVVGWLAWDVQRELHERLPYLYLSRRGQ